MESQPAPAPHAAPAIPQDPARLPGILLAVCAGLLLLAMVTKGWASATEGNASIGAGYFGFVADLGERSETMSWSEGADRLDIVSDAKTFRVLALGGGFFAVAAFGFAAAMCLVRTPGKVPVKLIQVLLGPSAFFVTWFAVRLWMSDRDVNFGPSWGAFLGIGAIVAGGGVLRRMVPKAAAAMATAGAGPQA